MHILLIDTSNNTSISVGLRIDKKEFFLTQEGSRRSQVVLPLIDSLLGQHGLTLKVLTGIEVNLGPGSFTGLRVGVSIANTLAHSLHLPINGGRPGEPVEPTYS